MGLYSRSRGQRRIGSRIIQWALSVLSYINVTSSSHVYAKRAAAMKKVVGKPFSNKEVTLDGHHYQNCRFESCSFVYAAADRFLLEENRISADCRFVFTGKAADTLGTMKAIYSMGEWGRSQIVSTFQEIAPDLKNLH